jgi:hypothetical protein
MKKQNANFLSLKSFEPVLLKSWVLTISLNEANEGILIVLFHRYEHILRCSYVIGQEEAANFIEHIIETYK